MPLVTRLHHNVHHCWYWRYNWGHKAHQYSVPTHAGQFDIQLYIQETQLGLDDKHYELWAVVDKI